MFFLRELPDRATLERYAGDFPEMDVEAVERGLRQLRAASLLLRDLDAYFRRYGLSQTRFLILIVIDREPSREGLTGRDLVARLDVSKPVVSTTARALVEEGLLTVTVDPDDARAQRYRLTARGRRRLRRLLPGYYARFAAHEWPP